jgi:hypothetical protein
LRSFAQSRQRQDLAGCAPKKSLAASSAEQSNAPLPHAKEATKLGFVPYQYEVSLTLGGAEMRSGEPGGRVGLAALEKDATAKSFLLIAREAAAGAK